jgi:hypothetical protein
MARRASRHVERGKSPRRKASLKGKETPKRWEKLMSLPFLTLTTALTVVVTWLVTQALADLERERDLENPVTVSLQANPARVTAFDDLGIAVVLPPQAEVAPDPGAGCEDFHPTLFKEGGADAGVTRLQVVVQGSTTSAVLVSSMRAVVTRRVEPWESTVAICPSAGGAQIRPVRINLDRQSPVAELESSNTDFGFTVAQGETETFLVSATTEECFCEWHLEIELVVAGERHYREIRNGSQQFRTTAYSDSGPSILWDYEGSWHVDGKVIRPGETLP